MGISEISSFDVRIENYLLDAKKKDRFSQIVS
jgi:hypothetical protein